MNLYAYVGGDPVNYNDPSGLCPNCITGIAGAFGAGVGNVGSQKLNTGSVDPLQVTIAATGGALGVVATLPLGASVLEAFSAASINTQFGFAARVANKIIDRTGK